MHSLRRMGRVASASFVVLVASLYACSDAGTPERTIAPNAAPSRATAGTGSGLVAAYAFDEASGTTTADASGSGNTGVLGRGVTHTTAGRFGGALAFNEGGYVAVPGSSSLALSSAMTLEAWVNPSTVDANWRAVLQKGNDNYYLMATSANAARPAGGGRFGGAPADESYGTALVAMNAWTHLAVTYDGATVRFYANGTQVSSVTKTGAIMATSDSLGIGGDAVYGQFFRGVIDEVRIYNRALSAAEITTDMNTPITSTAKPPTDTVKPTAPGLVAAYGFEEPSGSTTADGSGKGNTGSLDQGISRATSGKYGAALSFNNGTVTIPNSASLSLTTAMTLEAWVNPSIVSNQWRDVIEKGQENYYLMASTNNRSRPAGGGRFAGESRTTSALGAAALAAGTWTHLAVTYDGSLVRFYVNGTQTSTLPHTGAMRTSTAALSLGGDPFFGQRFRGMIDEVRIYNRALSAVEIQTDMSTPVGNAQSGAPAPPADGTPPQVVISSPQASGTYTTTATSVTLSGTASDNVGVAQVRWSNGAGTSGTFSGTSNWSGSISLASGTNAITVTAQDAANNVATATLTVVSNPPTAPKATQLAIARQPSSSAESGAAFAQQPIVQLRDASNNPVSQSGVVVTAAIASGGGTLGGTPTATTNASGVATFTNLSITGTAGLRTISFAAAPLTSVTSNSISISAVGTSPGGTSPGGSYPNRPSSFTQSSEVDFSQAIPSLPDNVDRPISGTTGWNMIYFGNNWTKTSDASAPQSAPGIWQGRWAAGSYGGGVIGAGSGHGIGNVFTYAANGTNRLYMSMRVYFDFDASQWHPISNKFVNLEGNNSLILMQLREGDNWRHAEELGASSFWVDNSAVAGEAHIAGQVANPPVPNRRWTQVEVLIDIPNHIFKIWQDGVLTTNATPTFASTKITTVGIYAFRGGGGETLTTDLFYKYDHFFIAW